MEDESPNLINNQPLNNYQYKTFIYAIRYPVPLIFSINFSGGKLDGVNWFRDPAICTLFLNGRCSEANACPLAHDTYGKPYVWQYKDDTQSLWQNFHPTLNDAVEKCFADPANSNFDTRYQYHSFKH